MFKVKVNDINIYYKIYRDGYPLIMIISFFYLRIANNKVRLLIRFKSGNEIINFYKKLKSNMVTMDLI